MGCSMAEHYEFYIICIHYSLHSGTCMNMNCRDECISCKIRLEAGITLPVKEIPDQRCYNFDNAKSACVICSDKRAGDGKSCHSTRKLDMAPHLAKKARGRSGTVEKILWNQKVREFDDDMKEMHNSRVKAVRGVETPPDAVDGRKREGNPSIGDDING